VEAGPDCFNQSNEERLHTAMRYLMVHRIGESKPDAYVPRPEMADMGVLMGEMTRAGVLLVSPPAPKARIRVASGTKSLRRSQRGDRRLRADPGALP
jgi:hypothetical protein